MPPTAVPVSAAQIVLEGAALDDALMSDLLEVQVRDNLLLPDTALVQFQDADGVYIDDQRFVPGKKIEIKFAARDEDVYETVFSGEVVAVEPEFGQNELVIAMRAYDLGWRLNRRRTSSTFVDSTAGDMVRKVGTAAGLTPGTVEPGGAPYKFFQQSMETDWEFCWRLARLCNYEFLVEGSTFHFRARKSAGAATTLKWGENLLAFRPRLTGVGQVTEVTVANSDPTTREVLRGTAKQPALPHTAPAMDERGQVVSGLKAGGVVVANHVAETQAEADKLAQSTLDRLAGSFVEAHGRAEGDPKLTAGATVKLEKVGTRFSGEYVLSQTTHRYTGGTNYVTAFTIAGRTSHTFRDLLRQGETPEWASSLVLGVVTNNNDPSNLGRVRVKFAALGDDIEGWWARVATAHAGKGGGTYFLPEVDDEVVVAFEHGDTRRPIVLGSLFNGRDTVPPELIDPTSPAKKPLWGVKTTDQAYVESQQQMTLRSHEKLTVEVHRDGKGGTGDFTLDAKGNVKQTAAQSFDVKGAAVTIKGDGSVTVEAQGGLTLKGATVDIQATGPVNVKGAVINLG